MTVEAVDDYTVKITLDKPLSPVLFYPQGGQLLGRLHRLQAGGRGAGRRQVQDQSRGHRPLHVRELQPPGEDRARGQPGLLPRRAAAGWRRVPLHGRHHQPRGWAACRRAGRDQRHPGHGVGGQDAGRVAASPWTSLAWARWPPSTSTPPCRRWTIRRCARRWPMPWTATSSWLSLASRWPRTSTRRCRPSSWPAA